MPKLKHDVRIGDQWYGPGYGTAEIDEQVAEQVRRTDPDALADEGADATPHVTPPVEGREGTSSR